jgi:hypothetical protein
LLTLQPLLHPRPVASLDPPHPILQN